MTSEQDTGEWQSEELRPTRRFQLPWLALAGVAATVIAAATLVVGISDSLDDDQPSGRLLPLQAASPPPPSSEEPVPEDTPERSEPRIHEALLRLRFSVDEGVEQGDVRDDVGLDLTNVIERILDRPRSKRADVEYLHHKIATRTREGAIDDDRADEFHLILDHATD